MHSFKKLAGSSGWSEDKSSVPSSSKSADENAGTVPGAGGDGRI